MLINIICEILRLNGYNELSCEFDKKNYAVHLYHPSDSSNRQEYYVAIEAKSGSISALDEIYETYADLLFERISSSAVAQEYFEKNSTLIICHNSLEFNSARILAIEEDPYNFKKNVITYTETELESLDKKLHSPDSAIDLNNESFNFLINASAGDEFRRYKSKSGLTEDYYSLLLKIAAKLPFLTYQPPKHKLKNLEDEIESELNQEEKNLYKKISAHQNIDDDTIFEALIKDLTSL